MKRLLSLTLAALLLAGCTAAPAASQSASSDASAPAASAVQVTPAPAEPPRPLRAGDAKQYYMTEMLSGGLIRYCVADLTAHETAVPCNVEGCTHDTEDCPATFRRGECDGVYVLDDNTLVAFTNNHFPETQDSQVILLDRNCQNRRVVATVTDATFDALGHDNTTAPYTDGTYLYCLGYHRGYGGQTALARCSRWPPTIRRVGFWTATRPKYGTGRIIRWTGRRASPAHWTLKPAKRTALQKTFPPSTGTDTIGSMTKWEIGWFSFLPWS